MPSSRPTETHIASSQDSISVNPNLSSGLPDFIGHVVAGRFQILEVVAEGGMSRVYLAEQKGLKRKVAIKFLKAGGDDWSTRFEREGQLLATLSHPNLVTIHEFGKHESYPYLVMEFVEGTTLAAEIKRQGRMPPPRVLRLATQIASGLHESHAIGVVHRDLKPLNILIAKPREQVKVIDFGVAKHNETDVDAQATHADLRIGSPRFMAPEQVAGDDVGPFTDVYALGCVMYAMLCGRPPFAHKNGMQTMLQHLNEPPTPVGERLPAGSISAEFEAVVMRCLEKEPSERYQGMDALVAAFRSVPEFSEATHTSSSSLLLASRSSGLVQTMVSQAPGPDETQQARRRLLPYAIVGVAVLLGAAAALLSGTEREPVSPSTATATATQPPPTPEPSPGATQGAEAEPSEPAAPAQPAVVMTQVSTEPAGARVELNGRYAGTTPLLLPIRATEIVDAQIELSGYEPMSVRLNASEEGHRYIMNEAPRTRRPRAVASAAPAAEEPEAPATMAGAAPPPSPPPPLQPPRPSMTSTGLTDNPDPWN